MNEKSFLSSLNHLPIFFSQWWTECFSPYLKEHALIGLILYSPSLFSTVFHGPLSVLPGSIQGIVWIFTTILGGIFYVMAPLYFCSLVKDIRSGVKRGVDEIFSSFDGAAIWNYLIVISFYHILNLSPFIVLSILMLPVFFLPYFVLVPLILLIPAFLLMFLCASVFSFTPWIWMEEPKTSFEPVKKAGEFFIAFFWDIFCIGSILYLISMVAGSFISAASFLETAVSLLSGVGDMQALNNEFARVMGGNSPDIQKLYPLISKLGESFSPSWIAAFWSVLQSTVVFSVWSWFFTGTTKKV